MKVKSALKKAVKFITNSPTRMIVLSFAAAIFVGAFLLCLPIASRSREWFNFGEALFTSTSAICVTGLVVVDTATHFSIFGQIVVLVLIQLGGLGVMTGATLLAIAVGKKISLKNRITIQESFGENRLQGGIKLVKRIIAFTLIAEAIGALMLLCSFVPRYGARGIWPSIFISVSAYCNAGFDVLGALEAPFASLTPFANNVFVLLPVAALIIIGGLGIPVVRDCFAYRPKKHKLTLHTKMVLITTAVLIALGWIYFAAVEWNRSLADLSVGGRLISSFFQSVSPRTAGFNSIDLNTMTPASYLMTIIFMFIGASPASTGGGIKTTTFVCLFIIIASTIRGEREVNIGKSKLNHMAIRKVVTTVSVAVLTVVLGSVLLLLFEQSKGIGAKSVVFEVVSAFATVGLSLGITPELGWASQLVLGMVMFIGRTGPLSLGASIVKSNRDYLTKVEYTDAKILL